MKATFLILTWLGIGISLGRFFSGSSLFAEEARMARSENGFAPEISPVICQHVTSKNPRLSIHWVKIDLTDPRVSIRVSPGGEKPSAASPWVTTLLPTSEIAEREHYDIAINGDFFRAENTVDIEGKKTGYVRGKLAEPQGPAMTDGRIWHEPTNACECLEITLSNMVRFVKFHPADSVAPSLRQIIGGRPIIVRDGRVVVSTNKFSATRNPRTAVGLDKDGTHLILLVVDGRQPKLSVGMSLPELAAEMIRLNCYTAINLDGGGSSTLVYREPSTQKLRILNSPSDTKERSVADILGVTVRAPMPEAD